MSDIEDQPSNASSIRVPVDWSLSARAAARLVRPGPVAYRDELVALVDDLRESATEAVEHVAAITGLPEARPEVRVIDRSSWARVNVEIVERFADGSITGRSEAGARFTAMELGAGVALLSSKVLGQFDPFTSRARETGGQLLLVAPNILMIERELDLAPGPFRLWVCLHEQTHAAQFGAAPWLADHMRGRMGALLESLEDDDDRDEGGSLAEIITAVQRFVRDDQDDDDMVPSVIDGSLSDDQRLIFDEITGIMSLIEGHADVVMDEVGTAVVPGVDDIRKAFEQRRSGGRRLDHFLRRFLGLDAKLAQYRNGAVFVRAVLDEGGMDLVNRVWEGPQALPTSEEIMDPQLWIKRIG